MTPPPDRHRPACEWRHPDARTWSTDMHMTARFASTCAATGQAIARGDTIDYDKATKRATLVAKGTGTPAQAEPQGRTMRARYGSHYARFSSGAEVFRNVRGRCEDAPCCGCCS